ncbi:FxsA family protein [Ornithinibacillus halophilus]|uniref:UPF0716 protein FxsA n=1 Tax=Ornithinibacillus halophilus TaxID=930117 RepID=A0A1M5EG91_9BACI|nr:FxsA family protein [Ornithinibacillus halophilus]SHF78206.1 UPF0716 protein FxsA [Ornithinibacillus halophilus]
MRWLLLALIVVPAIEIGVFIWAGGIIGPWWVVALILLTGIVGVTLAKQQGMETWQKAQESMQYGQPPTKHIIDGICIFVGGVFLFSPGFITDIIGFTLVVPATRGVFKGFIMRFVRQMMDKNTVIYRKW